MKIFPAANLGFLLRIRGDAGNKKGLHEQALPF
jgi:hypothetical protein